MKTKAAWEINRTDQEQNEREILEVTIEVELPLNREEPKASRAQIDFDEDAVWDAVPSR
jgi:hypothetical protein